MESGSRPDVSPYDALLLVSFGGPEKPEDVVPFLENVTAGRGIPRERLEEVGQHYYLFGGRSPINDQNRALIDVLRAELERTGTELPVYWGNRNWDPYLADTLAEMARDGVRRAACFVTSAYSSYSSCRQYRENLAAAVAQVPGAPVLDRLRWYWNHPGFVEPFVEAIASARDELGDPEARLVFVTHSIPDSMNDASGPDGGRYLAQHRELADHLVERVTGTAGPADLVFCSRSGSPHTPWLEPDVNDHLEELAGAGVASVVLVPIGFVSDHMEVIYDLDTEAKQTAEKLGLGFVRVATPGTDPRFVAMIRELLLERAAAERGEDVEPVTALGEPGWSRCPAGCCANPRGPVPALGERG